MKVVSLKFRGERVALNELRLEPGPDSLSVHGKSGHRAHSFRLPFAGSTLEQFDTGRSVGHAAAGALAGGLFGQLGALAGAAAGGMVRHSIVGRWPDGTILVFECSTAELQQLMGEGIRLGEPNPGSAETSHEERSTWASDMFGRLLLAALVLGLFWMCSR